MAGLFQVLYGRADGSFQKAKVLNGTDGKPLIIPIADKKKEMAKNICTRPTAVDWDDDGDLDLVVGNFEGSFFVFAGKGKGQFDPKPEQVMTRWDAPLLIEGVHSDPAVVDWDGDGDLDIVSGSSRGGVDWSENRNEAEQRMGQMAFRPLVEAGEFSMIPGSILKRDELTGPTQSTRVWVADVDSDGKLDLLVGDKVNLTSPAKGLSEEEFRKDYYDWMEGVRTLSKQMRDPELDSEALKKVTEDYRSLYTSKEEFMDEQRTGFVWLYRQK